MIIQQDSNKKGKGIDKDKEMKSIQTREMGIGTSTMQAEGGNGIVRDKVP